MSMLETLALARKSIDDHPEQHDQSSWGWNGTSWITWEKHALSIQVFLGDAINNETGTLCNGHLCVAGWMAYHEKCSISAIQEKYPELDNLFMADSIDTNQTLEYLDLILAGSDPYEIATEAKQLSKEIDGTAEDEDEYEEEDEDWGSEDEEGW